MSMKNKGGGALLAGELAVILAFVCCFGPLSLAALGLSGVWILKLTLLEPYRSILIGAALALSLVLFFFAWRRARCAARPIVPNL